MMWEYLTSMFFDEGQDEDLDPPKENVTHADFDDIVKSGLDRKFTLSEVKTNLEETFAIGYLDCEYVEDVYIKTLVSLWIEEASQRIISHFQPQNLGSSIERFYSIKTFLEYNEFLSNLSSGENESAPYNKLIIGLAEDSSKLTGQEDTYICQLKQVCISNIFLKLNYISNELSLLQAFENVIKASKCPSHLCEELMLKSFIDDEISLAELLQFIENLPKTSFERFDELKIAVMCMPKDTNYYYVENLKETVSSYLKPFAIGENLSDGRHILEVSGRHIVISNVLRDIEKRPRFQDVEEVRFVNAGAIHIDCDLEAMTWHGKNLVLIAETLIVVERVTWDVSGQSSVDPAIENLAPGADGTSGTPGESGGNVLILVESVKNGQNLSIISCGGNGSNGQDGGTGADGEEGESIGKLTFKKCYPPVSKFKNKERLENLKTTLNSTLKNLKTIKKFYYGSSELKSPISNEAFKYAVETNIGIAKDIYYEVKTTNDCEITFSFYHGGYFSSCQSFLLYNGSFGKAGKAGGRGGLGGSAGFAGEIKIEVSKDDCIDIVRKTFNGEKGKSGRMGLPGESGQNGVDIGYMDCSVSLPGVKWLPYDHMWPQMYESVPDDTFKLKVDYLKESETDRVWCPYYDCYAKIVFTSKDKSRLERVSERAMNHSTEINRETQVIRKKTINKESVLKKYHNNVFKQEVHKIQDIEVARTKLEEMMNNDLLQEESVSEKVNITKHIRQDFFSYKLCPSELEGILKVNCIVEPSCRDEIEKDSLIIRLVLDSESIDVWKSLIRLRLNYAEMNDIWVSCYAHTSIPQVNCNTLHKLMLDKYKLAVIEEIECNILSTANIHETFRFSKHCSTAALTTVRDTLESSDEEVLSEEFQNLSNARNIVCNDSRNIRFSMVEQYLNKTEDKCLKRDVVNLFLKEFGSKHPELKVHVPYKLLLKFKKEKQKKLKIKLSSFKIELLRPNNKTLFHLLAQNSEQDNLTKITLENHISEDIFLNELFKVYLKETKDEFNLTKHRNSDRETTVLNEMFKYMEQKGPISFFYREYVAIVFNINLRVYTESKSGCLTLKESHNHDANTVLHVLRQKNKFVQLNVDKNLAEMVEIYQGLNKLFSQILLNINTLEEKNNYDDYVNKDSFIFDDFKSVDKSAAIRVKVEHTLNQDIDIQMIANFFQDKNKSFIQIRLEKLKYEFSGYVSVLYFMALHLKCEGNKMSVKEWSFIVNILLECSTSELYIIPMATWIIAAYPHSQWLVELVMLKLELKLKQVLPIELKTKWKERLSAQKDSDTVVLFISKIEGSTGSVSVECIEAVLKLLAKIPNAHEGLNNIDFIEWKYYLKDKYWVHQLNATGSWSEEQLKNASYYLVKLENLVGIQFCEEFINILKTHPEDFTVESNKNSVLTCLGRFATIDDCGKANLLTMLASSSINEWQVKIDENIFQSNRDRNVRQLTELMNKSNNISTNILDNIDNIENSINRVSEIKSSLLIKKEQTTKQDKFTKFINTCKIKVTKWSLVNGTWSKQSSMDQVENNDIPVLIFNEFLYGLIHACVRNDEKEKKENLETYLKNHKFYLGEDICSLEKTSLGTCLATCVDELVLALIDLAIYHETGLNLRDTQKLTVMILQTNSKNTLAQVSTGEGKSLIVCALAIMRALKDQKVDVITSSHVLAVRDVDEYRNVYKLCGVSVGHNCSKQVEVRKKVYSSKKVVYGELGSFQRDYLLDRVYNRNTLGDRSFETVIVDEVDSMLLDKGNNILYLSHEIPGLDKINPVFLSIWNRLNILARTGEFGSVFNIVTFKETFMLEIFGQIQKECIRELDCSLSENEVNNIWNRLVEKKIIDQQGKVLIENLNEYKDNGNNKHDENAHIKYLLKKVLERKKPFEIPNYLKPFVEEHLEEWIKSGIRAMTMENGRDYVVDVDRSDTSCDRDPNITILDLDTGTDLENSQWDQGLHQFLQLKHGCKLSLVSLKAVFISNVSYLKLYTNLYGLTGTLGSEKDRDLLKSTYDVDFVTIPTAKAKCFMEEPSILCPDMKTWFNNIHEEVNKVIEKGRSVLIICETSKDVLNMRQLFPKGNVHTYTRDYECLSVADDLKPGNIIISTNLAGRGTDIKLSKELLKAGGLHVCLTFLPVNSRIEEQAFGRAARKGEPGSAQIIFKATHATNVISATKVIDLKKQRDVNDLLRLADVKKYHESQIMVEEKWFKTFHGIYRRLLDLKHKNDEIKSILLQSFLDQWAYWLEKNSKLLSLCQDSNVLDESFSQFQSKFDKLCDGKPEERVKQVEDPFQLLKLALVYISLKDYNNAILLFNGIIEKEPHFSEIASYYRVCAISNTKGYKPNELLSDLKIVANQLKERINCLVISGKLIDDLKQHSNNVLQINSFKKQQINESKIYNVFLKSINDIIGQEVTPQSFIKLGDLEVSSEKEETSTKLGSLSNWFSEKFHRFNIKNPGIDELTAYNFYIDLKEEGVLNNTKIKANITDVDFMFVKSYGMCPMKTCAFFKEKAGKRLNETEILKEFKKQCFELGLPLVEILWKELKVKHILTDEKKYTFLNLQKLNEFNPSLTKGIKKLGLSEPLCKNTIWLYPFQNTKVWKVFEKANLKCKIGKRNFKLLKTKGVLENNKQATFDRSNDKHLKMFDSISKKDFDKVGIDHVIAAKIINELVGKGIIYSRNNVSYFLASDFNAINTLELSSYKAYTEDVKYLLYLCFSFRMALQKVMNTTDLKNIFFEFPREQHKQVFYELIDRGIIRNELETGSRVAEILARNHPAVMSKQILMDEVFCGSLELESKATVFQQLIEKGKLVRPISDYIKFSKPEYYIDYTALSNEEPNKSNTLCQKLISDTEITNFVLFQQRKLTSKKNHEFVENCLKEAGGAIQKDEFTVSLKPLLTVLEKYSVPTSELPIFSLNGFDQLLFAEEKKYTWKMWGNVSLITVVAVAEVTVGTLLGPLGSAIQAQGIGDLIYTVTCLWSGYFSWESYLRNKALTAAFSLFTYSISFLTSTLFQSAFGEWLTKLPYVKDAYASLFSASEALVQTNKAVVVKSLVRNVAKTTAFSIGYETLINSVGPALKKSMTEEICKNIGTKIKKHKVHTTLKKLYLHLKQEKAKLILEEEILKKNSEIPHMSISKILKSYFVVTMSSNISQSISNLFKGNDTYTNISNFLPTLTNVCILALRQGPLLLEINRGVDKILDDIEKGLLFHLQSPDSKSETPKESDFVAAAINDLEDMLKVMIFDEIEDQVIVPILRIVEESIFDQIASSLTQKNTTTWSDKKFLAFEKYSNCSKEEVRSAILKRHDFVYDQCLNQLLKKTKSKNIFLEMLKNNCAVDKSCIEFCSFLITKVLKEKGVDVNGINLVFETDGTHQSISTTSEKNRLLEIVIPAESVSDQKGIFIQDFLDRVYLSVLDIYPNLKETNANSLTNLLIEALYVDSIQKVTDPSNTINDEIEGITPCQHSHPDGRWLFNGRVDVDLRKGQKLVNEDEIKDHILLGFNSALKKVNDFTHRIQINFPTLVLEDLMEVEYDMSPGTKSLFNCYCTEYKLLMPVPQKQGSLVDVRIVMTLKDTHGKIIPCNPLGPHILYEISPVLNRYFYPYTKGHILLNLESQKLYSSNTCHAAGILMVPTKPYFHAVPAKKNRERRKNKADRFVNKDHFHSGNNFRNKSKYSNKLKLQKHD